MLVVAGYANSRYGKPGASGSEYRYKLRISISQRNWAEIVPHLVRSEALIKLKLHNIALVLFKGSGRGDLVYLEFTSLDETPCNKR